MFNGVVAVLVGLMTMGATRRKRWTCSFLAAAACLTLAPVQAGENPAMIANSFRGFNAVWPECSDGGRSGFVTLAQDSVLLMWDEQQDRVILSHIDVETQEAKLTLIFFADGRVVDLDTQDGQDLSQSRLARDGRAFLSMVRGRCPAGQTEALTY